MTINFKNPVVLVLGGVILGYMFSRQLDNVPLFNKLPKVRL